jgi:hypothetical protein
VAVRVFHGWSSIFSAIILMFGILQGNAKADCPSGNGEENGFGV